MRLAFQPTDGLCRICGRDAVGFTGEYLCTDCRSRRPFFERAASALRFEGIARELINAYKFRSAIHLCDDFVDFLEATTRVRFDLAEVSLMTSIPATLSHRLLRGFNPSEELSCLLARRLAKPYAKLLKRVGSPRRQGGLDEEERRKNVLGTFALKRPRRRIEGTVLLVDDVMTTGSTLSEAASILKLGGAARVWTVSLARSVRS